MRVRWISCRTKEIGLLKLSNTLAAQQSQYVCPLHLSITDRKRDVCDKSSTHWNAIVWFGLFFIFFNQVHRNAVQTEWQAFLNLCLAQETHLDNIEDYKKVKSLVLPCSTIPPNPFVHQSFFFSLIIVFFKPVPAGCRDVVWLPEQTQSQSGPKISKQQEQLWGPAGDRGTIDYD